MYPSVYETGAINRLLTATAAGATPINGNVLDMQSPPGFDSVCFIACLGTLTATQVTNLKAQQGNQANGSDMADIPGAITANALDADSNKCLLLDVQKSLISKRYVRPVVNRVTANAAVDAVLAIQYKAHNHPITQPAASVSQGLNAR